VNVSVINAGVPGYETREMPAIITLDLHRFNPDIVIVNSCWNDLKWISTTSDDTYHLQTRPHAIRENPLASKVNIFDELFGDSVVYRKIRDNIWKNRLGISDERKGAEGITNLEKSADYDVNRGFEQYRNNITSIASIIRNIGAQPVLAIEERLVHENNNDEHKKLIDYFRISVKSHDELVRLFEGCDAVIRDVSLTKEIRMIDANHSIGGKLEYFTDHVHTTPEGSNAIANHYYEFLKPLVYSLLEK